MLLIKAKRKVNYLINAFNFICLCISIMLKTKQVTLLQHLKLAEALNINNKLQKPQQDFGNVTILTERSLFPVMSESHEEYLTVSQKILSIICQSVLSSQFHDLPTSIDHLTQSQTVPIPNAVILSAVEGTLIDSGEV